MVKSDGGGNLHWEPHFNPGVTHFPCSLVIYAWGDKMVYFCVKKILQVLEAVSCQQNCDDVGLYNCSAVQRMYVFCSLYFNV